MAHLPAADQHFDDAGVHDNYDVKHLDHDEQRASDDGRHRPHFHVTVHLGRCKQIAAG